MPQPAVLVVGAGIAGLAAADALREQADVVVVDKGRGLGGRLATRRIGDATFDHGAQFVTPHSDAFSRALAGWEASGAVALWHRGTPGPDGVAGSPTGGQPRFRGVPGMTAIAKHVATGLDVRLGQRVISLGTDGDHWTAITDDGSSLTASSVILTCPVPQALELLAAGNTELADADAATLGEIRYDPCVAVMAPLSSSPDLPDPGAVRPAGGPVEWIADNAVKCVSATHAVTIHSTAQFAAASWERSDDDVIDELLAAAGVGGIADRGATQIHRWRYAKPSATHAEPFLLAQGLPFLAFAGDAFGGPNVEGAWASGRAAAAAVSVHT